MRALPSADPRPGEAAIDALCDPTRARILRALLRDTISPTVIHAGIKYNVIPGEATVEIDCRVLPGTTEEDMREIVVGRLGRPRGARRCRARDPRAGRRRAGRRRASTRSSPGPSATTTRTGSRCRSWSRSRPTPSTRPSSASRPTASPRSGSRPDDEFLDRFHGVDERVGVDALRWGLPVLYDVVRRFCG